MKRLIIFLIVVSVIAGMIGCGAEELIPDDNLEAVVREEPKYEGRYLELIIFGTLPAYQRQGLGRKMLNFLYNEAKSEEYKGVILVADRNTPAFSLYLKEGFIVDREFAMGEATLCWMRLTF